MQKRRFEILLPIMRNDGHPFDHEKFEQTHEELIVRFGAVSSLPGTMRGTWVNAGVRYQDDSVRLMIDVDETEANRQFFADWKTTLKDRFEQIEIYISSWLVDIT